MVHVAEMMSWALSTVVTDALVLKHKAISIHIADQMNIHYNGAVSYKKYIYGRQH